MDLATLILKTDTRGLKDGRSELDNLAKTGERTERRIGKSSDGMGRSISSNMRAAGVAIAGITATIATLGVALSRSQVYTELSNGLRATGQSAEQAAKSLDLIAGIATRTRSPLEATAKLYQRINIAGKDLGASQGDVLRFTENVGLALAQTGGSASEASGALLQLSQAMAGGVVRAEEFNSILEGAFPIAQAAANGIDGAAGSVGKLRKMVTEGKVSSKEFFDAILSQTDQLEAAFANTIPTIGQSMGVLGDSFTMLSGKMDGVLGISAAVSSAILFLAENLDQVGGYVASAAIVLTVSYLPAIWGAVGATWAWIAALVTLKGAIIGTGLGALIVLGGYLINQLLALVKATGSWGSALSLLGEVASGVWSGIVTSAGAIPDGLFSVWSSIKADFYAMISDMMAAWSGFLTSMNSFADRFKIPGTEDMGLDLLGKGADAAADAAGRYTEKAQAAASASSDFGKAAGVQATAGFEQAKAALGKLNVEVKQTETAAGAAAAGAGALTSALNGGGGGGGVDKAAQDAAKSTKELAAEIQRLEFDADPVKKYNHEVGKLLELSNAGLSQGAFQHAIDKLNEGMRGAKDGMESFKAAGKSAFESLITGASSWNDALSNVLSSMASIFANGAFDALFGGGKKGGGGGGWLDNIIGAIFPSANGNVFQNGSHVQAFATGGVVNGPTTFPMRGGRTGLMGEAGPEAIMPLTRGKNGKLGVQAEGGGNQRVELVIHAAEGVTVEQVGQISKDVAVQVNKAGFNERVAAAVNVGRKRRQI